MVNRRPTPDLVRARQWEIKRRYERHAKVGKRTRSMAAIRLAELTRWLHDTHGAGCELEPGRDALMIAEIFAHHIAALANAERRIAQWLSFYAPSIPPLEQEHLIGNALGRPIHWSADKLGWKLRLTDEQRTRLKIKTIGAMGISKEQRKERDRIRRAEAERIRRAAKRANRVPYI
jgi:hypothetical protein